MPVRLGEHGRQLERKDTNNSLGGDQDKPKPKPKPAGEGKAINWVSKGKAKIKDARSVLTDARCLRGLIEQKQKSPETSKLPDCPILVLDFFPRCRFVFSQVSYMYGR